MEAMVASKSLASLRLRRSQAKKRLTTRCRGRRDLSPKFHPAVGRIRS